MNIVPLVLAAADGGAKPAGQGFDPVMLLMIVGMVAVFWFLLIRPQKRREQQRREMLNQIKKGARIRTIGGIYGEVVTLRDKFVVIKVDKDSGAKMKVARAAVSQIVTEEDEAEEQD